MPTMEYLTSTDVRVGWILAPSGELAPVVYANVDGWAVFEGCILLDKTDNMENVVGRIRNFPEIVTNKSLRISSDLRSPTPGRNGRVWAIFTRYRTR